MVLSGRSFLIISPPTLLASPMKIWRITFD
jgi:hypothetical protein